MPLEFSTFELKIKCCEMSRSRDNHIFRFKEFEINQLDCAMKINTDGVVLGAWAGRSIQQTKRTHGNFRILDIGTGTGVIALMLAQRFEGATIVGVELDELTARRAAENFKASVFANRLTLIHQDALSCNFEEEFDLIVSNPPYFIDSLKNPDKKRELARHVDKGFFQQLLNRSWAALKPGGLLEMILPVSIAEAVHKMAADRNFIQQNSLNIYSFSMDASPVRQLICLQKPEESFNLILQPKLPQALAHETLVLYAERGKYTEAYKLLLKDFFLAF